MKNIEIKKLNHQGMGIGKIDNKVVFIPNTLPGDIVDIEVLKDNKNYLNGQVIKYRTLSSFRKKFDCSFCHKCGGCQIGELVYKEQLEYKKNKVKEIFKKYAFLDLDFDIIEGNDIEEYRNKITLHVKNNKLGYYSEKTNEIIEIDECLLISKKMNELIKLIKEIDLNNIEEIIIRENNNQLMLIVRSQKIKIDTFINLVKNNVTSFYINNRCVFGKKYLIQTLGDYDFKISPTSFFQINTKQIVKLYDIVKKYIKLNPNKKVLDLFCGTGTIGIYISKYCKEILGIEVNDKAIEDANYNKKINNINNINFKCQDVSKITTLEADIVIIDPPRSGLSLNTIQLLKNNLPKQIIYISCNPLTLARDVNKLKDNYQINDHILVDMFPNTYHVECVCVLNRH